MNEDCTLVYAREGYGEVMVVIRNGEVEKVATREETWHSWGPPLSLERKEER